MRSAPDADRSSGSALPLKKARGGHERPHTRLPKPAEQQENGPTTAGSELTGPLLNMNPTSRTE